MVSASHGLSHFIVCFCALLSRHLRDSLLRVLAYLGPFLSFLEMNCLGDFEAPLDSVALLSVIECIARALAVDASGSFGRASFFLGSLPLWVPPQPLCLLLFFCPDFSGTALVLLRSRLLGIHPHPLCAFAFLSWLLLDSFCVLRIPASQGPSPFIVFLGFTLPASQGQPFARPCLSFLEMNCYVDFNAPLDSVALVSVIECIRKALAVAASLPGFSVTALVLLVFRLL